MKSKKQVAEIRKSSFKTGKALHKKFKKTGGVEVGRASISAFNLTLKAIKYQVLYRTKKNKLKS